MAKQYTIENVEGLRKKINRDYLIRLTFPKERKRIVVVGFTRFCEIVGNLHAEHYCNKALKSLNHDAYILKSAIDGETYPNGFVSHRTNVYRADGSIIRCAWIFGPTGKADRWGALTYEAKKQFIIRTTNGLNGATMRGYGARLKFIDWDGTKYAEAIEKSKRTGKRILYS